MVPVDGNPYYYFVYFLLDKKQFYWHQYHLHKMLSFRTVKSQPYLLETSTFYNCSIFFIFKISRKFQVNHCSIPTSTLCACAVNKVWTCVQVNLSQLVPAITCSGWQGYCMQSLIQIHTLVWACIANTHTQTDRELYIDFVDYWNLIKVTDPKLHLYYYSLVLELFLSYSILNGSPVRMASSAARISFSGWFYMGKQEGFCQL